MSDYKVVSKPYDECKSMREVKVIYEGMHKENTALKAELANLKKIERDRWANAKEVFGLNLGEENV